MGRPKATKTEAEQYADRAAREAARQRRLSASGREVGPLPEVADADRKNRCLDSLRLFLETYLSDKFPLPWGRNHLELIETIQRVILDGGQHAVAEPRGSGKTTIAEGAAIWAAGCGHRSYVALIGATEKKAEDLLASIKVEIETNDLLAADFPEMCYPVRRLDGINNRAAGQLLDGEPTRIEWTQKFVSLPVVRGSACSGAVIQVAGITGAIRGMSRTMPGGRKARPDLLIIDDPQTDESARSPIQNDTREAILNGAILGLAGPGKKIAAVMPCTVIRRGDMAHRCLDRKRNPEWQGRTGRLLNRMPARLDLWERYGELLREGMRLDPPTRAEATAFYRDNRADMDEGAEASWPARYEPGQLSAVQFAMDLYLLKPQVFFAEYQNDPVDDRDAGGAEPIDPAAAAEKVNRVPRGEVPVECGRLTCGIDVQQEIIFWVVCAWTEGFSGAVVDFGTFPKQHTARCSAADPMPSLSSLHERAGTPLEGRIYAGLEAVAAEVLARDWPRAGGHAMRIERALVDTGYLPETVHQWARQTAANGVVSPYKGMYVGAARTPFRDWRPALGDKYGPGWRQPVRGTKLGRPVLVDSNHWKTFVAERLRTPMGSPGCLSLFGTSPAVLLPFCDHLGAEHPVRVSTEERTVDEWQQNPGRPDNHWFDCLVMAAAAASVAGVRWSAAQAAGRPDPAPAPRKQVSLRELQQAHRDAGAAVPGAGALSLRELQQKRRR